VAAGLAVLVLLPAAIADKWTPFQFRATERYEYKVLWRDGDQMVEGGYVLELKPTDRKNEEGQPLVQVSVTTIGYSAKDRIESDPAGEVWGRHAINFSMLALNPMYAMFFQQLDMKVGEKMSFFGAGVVKVTGKEKIGEREGFVCQFYQQADGGNEQLTTEYVIDPALALPLRSKVFDGEDLQSTLELTSYTGE
jgi:hypothetical protein